MWKRKGFVDVLIFLFNEDSADNDFIEKKHSKLVAVKWYTSMFIRKHARFHTRLQIHKKELNGISWKWIGYLHKRIKKNKRKQTNHDTIKFELHFHLTAPATACFAQVKSWSSRLAGDSAPKCSQIDHCIELKQSNSYLFSSSPRDWCAFFMCRDKSHFRLYFRSQNGQWKSACCEWDSMCFFRFERLRNLEEIKKQRISTHFILQSPKVHTYSFCPECVFVW